MPVCFQVIWAFTGLAFAAADTEIYPIQEIENMSKSKRVSSQTGNQKSSSKKSGIKTAYKIVLGSAAVLLIGTLVWLPTVNMAGAPEITVYKSATCGCCSKWVDHLRDAGFKVTTHNRQDMNQVKQSHGVKYQHRSCHTAVVEDYVVEGHVPAEDIQRLLDGRPAISGLAVPGMPMGSPGMEGKYNDPYEVIAFKKDGGDSVFSKH